MHPAGTRLVDGKPLEQEGQPAGPVPPVQVPDNLPRAVFSNNTFADDDGGGETKQVRWDMAPTRSPPTGTLTKATPAGTKHRRSQPIASRSPSGFNGSPYLPMRWEKRVEQLSSFLTTCSTVGPREASADLGARLRTCTPAYIKTLDARCFTHLPSPSWSKLLKLTATSQRSPPATAAWKAGTLTEPSLGWSSVRALYLRRISCKGRAGEHSTQGQRGHRRNSGRITWEI